MQNDKFKENLEILKEQIDKTLSNINILDNDLKENFLRNLEKIRYDIFDSIEIENRYSQKQDIDFINKHYEVQEKDGILKITIPEVLPKYKNVSNPAYKNILLNVKEAVKDYQGLFQDQLTFVMIIVHERQVNIDIDNKYIKPIIDALVSSNVIKDDNFSNMFYAAMGRNDTVKPFTEVYVLDGSNLLGWIKAMQNMF